MRVVSERPSAAIIGTRGYVSHYGGFETAVRHLAPFLVDSGWDVVVYGRHGSVDETADRDERVRSVMTAGLSSKSLSTLSFGFTSVLHAMRHKPDVALVMNVANGFVLPLLRLRGIPVLVNVDGIEWEREKWGRLARFMFRAGARFTALFANNIVVDAHEIGRVWKARFNRSGTFIPYGGSALPPLPVEAGLTHRGYVLMVARLVPENSIAEFIAAVDLLPAETGVLIVGTTGHGGALDDEVAALAARNPRVSWLGHVADDQRLHALWQHAGAYFHGHSVGGTNPALVQAMASGAPIVARDTVFNREVLGDTGVLVQPTGEAIAAAISSVLADSALQQKLSAEGAARAAEHYTWEGVCGDYEKALRALKKR